MNMKKIYRPIHLIIFILFITIVIMMVVNFKDDKPEKKQGNACQYNGEIVDGVIYTQDQYTYTYKKDQKNEGWKIELTNKNSTSPVNSKICNSINGKYIMYTIGMFKDSKSSSIDISSLDSSHVIIMNEMFANTSAKEIIGLDKLNTSSTYSMDGMFENSNIETLNLTNFDTKSVTSMIGMFANSKASYIDVTSFNTSRVLFMTKMFYNVQVNSLDLTKFDISNVKMMDLMFGENVSPDNYFKSTK